MLTKVLPVNNAQAQFGPVPSMTHVVILQKGLCNCVKTQQKGPPWGPRGKLCREVSGSDLVGWAGLAPGLPSSSGAIPCQERAALLDLVITSFLPGGFSL